MQVAQIQVPEEPAQHQVFETRCKVFDQTKLLVPQIQTRKGFPVVHHTDLGSVQPDAQTFDQESHDQVQEYVQECAHHKESFHLGHHRGFAIRASV